MVLQCSDCKKVFGQNKSLKYHIDNKVCSKSFRCKFCGNFLKTKNSLKTHRSQYCKMNPKSKNYDINYNELTNNNNDNEINEVKEDELENKKVLPNDCAFISKEELFSLIVKMQEERDKMKEEMQKQVQEEIKKLRSELITTNVNNGKINNSKNKIINNQININNNNQVTNNQTINIVGFGKEDLSKLSKNEVFRCLKSGLCFPTEMTIYVNFNKDFPENHNIQLSNVRDSNIKFYDGEDWNTILYDDFYDNMVERQMTYVNEIKENKDVVYERLPPITKKILEKIEDLENIDANKYKKIKQKFRNRIIDKRGLVAKTQKMMLKS